MQVEGDLLKERSRRLSAGYCTLELQGCVSCCCLFVCDEVHCVWLQSTAVTTLILCPSYCSLYTRIEICGWGTSRWHYAMAALLSLVFKVLVRFDHTCWNRHAGTGDWGNRGTGDWGNRRLRAGDWDQAIVGLWEQAIVEAGDCDFRGKCILP